jgi:sec-independent protein translocase protein TatB
MFDITSSKLLILAIMVLFVVGPKDLPILLRAIGKYTGVMRRYAADFRTQFDETMREAELDQVKKDFDGVGREMHATMKLVANGIDSHVESAPLGIDRAHEAPLSSAAVESNGDPLLAIEAAVPKETRP